MLQLFQRVHEYIKEHALISPGSTVVLGLSGGPDSLFLLHFLAHWSPLNNVRIIAAHLDHGWREGSYLDALFCKTQAEKFNITFISQHASQIVLIKKTGGSQEELGRLLRRQFFESVAQEYNAQTIALAHHRDDLFETFFIRLLRGAGLAGLASIRSQNGLYIRPLLSLTKQEIVSFLDMHKIAYLVDPTNISDVYLRNRIRTQVMPDLQKCDVRFEHNFVKTIENLQETEDFLVNLTEQIFTSISQENASGDLLIDVSALLSLELYMQKRIILFWLCYVKVPFTPSQSFFAEILRFLNKKAPREHQLNTEWSIALTVLGAFVKRKNVV